MTTEQVSLYGFEKAPYTLMKETQEAVEEAYEEGAGIASLEIALYKLKSEIHGRRAEWPKTGTDDIDFFKKLAPIGIAWNHGVTLTEKYLEAEKLMKKHKELDKKGKELRNTEFALNAREKELEKREKAVAKQEKALLKKKV